MDLQELMANYKPVNITPVQQPQKKKKNFWVDRISDVGGILGGVAGTFMSPIVGTGVGAAGGAGIGQALENAIMGESLGQNVGKEALISGVLGAGPIKLLKGAGAGAKALVTGADDVAGIASKAALTPLRQKAGESLVGAADNLAVKQFRLTGPQLTNLKKTLGEDPGKFIRKYGFQSADDITTKAIQPLQSEFDSIVANVGNISKKQIKDQLDMVIKPYKTSVSLQEQALAKNLQAQADEILRKSGKTLTGKDVLDLRQLFDNGVNYTQKGTAEFNVAKGMADGLRKTLQNVADGANLTASDGRTLKEVGRELNKLRKLFDVVEPREQLGRGSLPLNIGNLPGAVIGGGTGGPGGAAVGYAMNAIANSPTGRRVTASVADRVGSKLAQTAGGQSLTGIAGRVGSTGLMRGFADQVSPLESATMNQSLENRLTSDMVTNTSNPMPSSSNMDASYSQSQQMSSDSPFAPQNLESAIMQIMSQGGDMKDVSNFLSVAKTINELTAPAPVENKKLNATQIQQSNNAMSALNDIASIKQTMSADPSVGLKNALPGGSFTRSITGTSNYEAMRQNVADALGRLRSGGAINKDEEKRFLGLLPNAFDNQQVASQKLARLEELFMSFAYPQSSSGSLEDALMQAQMQGAY